MYTNFGHPPLLCLRAAGPVELHKAGGPALSVFEQAHYDVGLLRLAPGDTLVIYTDGVTELAGPDEADFGLERLLAALQGAPLAPPREMQARVIGTAREFHGADTFPDDLTLVILRRTP
jgi:serine phosphatase RsbU (regulator of sigma subunit)